MCEKYVRCGLKISLLTILDQHFVLWYADDQAQSPRNLVMVVCTYQSTYPSSKRSII